MDGQKQQHATAHPLAAADLRPCQPRCAAACDGTLVRATELPRGCEYSGATMRPMSVDTWTCPPVRAHPRVLTRLVLTCRVLSAWGRRRCACCKGRRDMR